MRAEAMDGEMNQKFGIDFEWLPRESGDVLEAASFAALTIRVNGQVGTEAEDLLAKTIRSNVRASAYCLALWLASNWWRLRWEPEAASISWKMSHNLAAAGGGYAWPDLSFNTDGEVVWVHCRPTPVNTPDPIRFLSNFDTYLPVAVFKRGLDDFVAAVIERVTHQAKNASLLSELWGDVLEERRVPELAEWRKLEAMMGFDPEQGPEGLIDGLRNQSPGFGKGLVEELAAAAGSKALDVLDFLKGEGQSRTAAAEIPEAASIANQLPGLFEGSLLPWQKGAAAARLARSTWRLGPGPVSNGTLCDLFGLSESVFHEPMTVPRLAVSAGYRDNGAGNTFRLFLNKKHPSSLRFSLGRLVGDHLLADSRERILPATEAKTARQKFQRAFAQEFFCPFEELMQSFEGGGLSDDGIEDAAAYFEVSPLLVKTLLVNRGVLGRDVLDI